MKISPKLPVTKKPGNMGPTKRESRRKIMDSKIGFMVPRRVFFKKKSVFPGQIKGPSPQRTRLMSSPCTKKRGKRKNKLFGKCHRGWDILLVPNKVVNRNTKPFDSLFLNYLFGDQPHLSPRSWSIRQNELEKSLPRWKEINCRVTVW